MSLQGSITGLQDNIAELYLELEHRFTENHLIRDLWGTMAHDVAQQARSLKALPHSFWLHIKDDGSGLSEEVLKKTRQQVAEKKDDSTLRDCFERALWIEEATILKLYIPIIRNLRKNWTDQALDFYIMVKAHLARIVRVTEAFSGDPSIIRRAHELLKNFEKEVQEPDANDLRVSRVQDRSHATRSAQGRKQADKSSKAHKPARAIAKHAKTHRAKPLVEKISLPRRHARSR